MPQAELLPADLQKTGQILLPGRSSEAGVEAGLVDIVAVIALVVPAAGCSKSEVTR